MGKNDKDIGLMSELNELVYQSIEPLDAWLTRNGWAGYDPYDLKGSPLFINDSSSTVLEKAVRKVSSKTESFAPRILRRIFRVKKEINAKAMGLFADGYLNLYRSTKKRFYFDKAEEAIQWLDKNYSVEYSGK